MSEAGKLFEAYYAKESAESRLCDLLSGMGIQWDDFHYDPYDSSLEIYACSPDYVMPIEHKEKLREWGFGQVWTHTRNMGDNNASDKESWYSLANFESQRLHD